MTIVEVSTLSQQIAEDLATKIVEGKLKSEERLIENDLTKIYGTSRSPIREALYLLENQGIVERIPRKGVIVKKYTKEEIIDLYDAVYGIQEYVLRKVINNIALEDLTEHYSILSNMEESIRERNFKRCFTLIEELQVEIFKLSNNTTIIDIYERLNKKWTTFRYLTLSHPESLIQSMEEYRTAIRGLEQKDIETVISIFEIKKNRGLSILENIVKN